MAAVAGPNSRLPGFELVSSRRKLFVNLAQAARQNVAMPAEILKLTTVFR